MVFKQEKNMPAEQAVQTTVDVKDVQSTEGRRFRRNKKSKKVTRTEETIVDPNDPNITFLSHLRIIQIFGWNLILVFIGALGTMAYGLIPIVVQYILGDLIDSFVYRSADTTVDQLKEAVADTAKKFTIITFCGMAAFAIQHFFLQLSNARLGTSLRRAYMSALVKQEQSFFDIKKLGALTVVLSEDSKYTIINIAHTQLST